MKVSLGEVLAAGQRKLFCCSLKSTSEEEIFVLYVCYVRPAHQLYGVDTFLLELLQRELDLLL
jgi:hypothetical protein